MPLAQWPKSEPVFIPYLFSLTNGDALLHFPDFCFDTQPSELEDIVWDDVSEAGITKLQLRKLHRVGHEHASKLQESKPGGTATGVFSKVKIGTIPGSL